MARTNRSENGLLLLALLVGIGGYWWRQRTYQTDHPVLVKASKAYLNPRFMKKHILIDPEGRQGLTHLFVIADLEHACPSDLAFAADWVEPIADFGPEHYNVTVFIPLTATPEMVHGFTRRLGLGQSDVVRFDEGDPINRIRIPGCFKIFYSQEYGVEWTDGENGSPAFKQKLETAIRQRI